MAKHFNWRCEAVSGIDDLAKLIQKFSKEPNRMLIRGEPVPKLFQKIERRKEHFPEPPEGRPWLMLDFDDVALPEGISAIDPKSIEFLVSKLPEEFHNVSYFYQFSSSAGIVNPDGKARKSGISAHLFYWLDRPVHGKDIAAWLRLHCIRTDSYLKTFDKGGLPRIIFAVDNSLFADIQPHFIALPEIGPSVRCDLTEENRQGLVKKSSILVQIPEFDAGQVSAAAAQSSQILRHWNLDCGRTIKKTDLVRRASGGVASMDYYAAPSSQLAGGRQFVKALVRDRPSVGGNTVSFATLYLDPESSPGSWYVDSRSPHVAVHHGDYSKLSLKELSEGAYAYVRDELRWFKEIVTRDLKLTETGHIPPFSEFLQARNTVLLAPTSTGKSSAFCQWVRPIAHSEIVIYAAQTIALTHQTAADLRNLRVQHQHYASIPKSSLLPLLPGIYVTTNESLKFFIERLRIQGSPFILIIDEVHVALDDFMRSERRNKLLDTALRHAKQTIFMTGTLTPIQKEKLALSVEDATGALTNGNFQFCVFHPERRRPLFWADARLFGADLVALMRTHKALKDQGQPIPRTVVIVPTSSIRVYQMLLEHFGLKDDAVVVSRREVLQEDIDAARVSTKPWLISSPLFAIGLNFDNPPVRFWTSFGRLQVDTSQIIQTVNRANRNSVECEVRLYAGTLDEKPPAYLNDEDERDKIEAFLLVEGDVPGVIEPVYQLDRMTYRQMRLHQEQITAKALFQLKRDNAIQNYTIVEDWEDDLIHQGDDAKLFKDFDKAAKASYDQDVEKRYVRHAQVDLDELELLLFQLKNEMDRRDGGSKESNSIPKDFDDEIRAILAAITGNPIHVKRSSGPDPLTILRLHGVELPFFSGQYASDKTQAWRDVVPDKVRSVARLLEEVKRLLDSGLNGVSFGKKMRLKEVRQGVLALVPGESGYVDWQRKLEKLDEIHDKLTNASKAERGRLEKKFFDIAKEFLNRIGVTFGKSTGANGKSFLNPNKPVVPGWDFADMALKLELLAESIANRDELEPGLGKVANEWFGKQFALKLCKNCVHSTIAKECLLGRPIQFFPDEIDPVIETCDKFKRLSARVLALKEAQVSQEI